MNDDLVRIKTLFDKKLPPVELKEATFLDIINQQSKENTISSIYAYFLNHNNSPEISQLFLDSLWDILRIEAIPLENYYVYKEYFTYNKMGRIDLVIESVESQSVIIIENKIYHWLHNDLQNYWDTFKRYKDSNKKGILLTLNPEKPTNSNFINITHIDWVNKILQRGIPSSISEKHKMYLNDFIENIKRLTNRIVMNDGIKFYLENSYEVEQVIKFRENASMYIIEKINSAASYFNWCVYGNEYKQMWDEINGVRIFYTLFPKQIMVNKELKIVIEIDSVAREYYDRLMESLNEEDFFDNNFKKTNEKNNFFAHILYYQEKLDVEGFDSLDEKIISIITEKLELKRKHIIKKLVEFGYSDKKNY